MNIQFRLNGRPVSVDVDAARHLLWVLRHELDLTGTKYGCGEELCGACTVLMNGNAVHACAITMGEVQDTDIITIEGLGMTRLQQMFVKHDALQCGFCTPGMIMTAHAFIASQPHPTRAQIIDAMDDNLCRCGAHCRIVAAIEEACA